MIVYPATWRMVGVPVSLGKIERAIMYALSKIDCSCLSFSGGVDSCLLLYYLLKLGRKVRTFTITCSAAHPDIEYSRRALAYFQKAFGVRIEGSWRVLNGVTGDSLVRAFYSGLDQWTDSIIAGDGIDEFMCGYYDHQKSPTEDVYFDRLRRLQKEHLEPLHENSGDIKVYVPYLSASVTKLLWQIPLADKVDRDNRKKIMLQLVKGKFPDEILERRKYGFGTTS